MNLQKLIGNPAPTGLNDWQRMLDAIYPRSLNAGGISTIALLEELGELAEAVRVFDRYPHYFYGEAADVFSYLMGLANEYALQCSEREETFNYELEFLSRYPGLCIACGARVCICPTVPPATVGRMAKEMPLSVSRISDADSFDAAGRETAEKVLESVGRVPALAKHLPYDRGDMNSVLTQLSFRLAHALGAAHKDTADRFSPWRSSWAARSVRVGRSHILSPSTFLTYSRRHGSRPILSSSNRLRVNNQSWVNLPTF